MLAYLNDVLCFHEEHLQGVERLLKAIRKSGFQLSERSAFYSQVCLFPRPHYWWGLGKTTTREDGDYSPAPKCKHKLRKFLGVCPFWLGFREGYSENAAPLHNLLKKPDFEWIPDYWKLLLTLKELLNASATLTLPDDRGVSQSHVMHQFKS